MNCEIEFSLGEKNSVRSRPSPSQEQTKRAKPEPSDNLFFIFLFEPDPSLMFSLISGTCSVKHQAANVTEPQYQFKDFVRARLASGFHTSEEENTTSTQ